MLKAFKKLWNNDRGNALIIVGAALPMLIGAAGLATDTIQWALWKRQLQRAADSAAIAGVYERNMTAMGATDGVEAAVLRDLTLNQHVGTLDGAPALDFPADVTTPDKRTNQVSVELKFKKSLTFSSMFLTIRRSSRRRRPRPAFLARANIASSRSTRVTLPAPTLAEARTLTLANAA